MADFRTFEMSTLDVQQRYQLMTELVIPRPIAWVSTVDTEGIPNLSPFSYFNCFGSNPPIVGFSPCLAEKEGRMYKKDTLLNIEATKECVIHLVDREHLHPMLLSSAGFAKGENEFKKAGVAMIESKSVSAPRISSAKVAFECELLDVLDYAEGKGGTQLVICKVKYIHVDYDLYEGGQLNWVKHVVGRLAGQKYHGIGEDQVIEMPSLARPVPFGVEQVIDQFPVLAGWSYEQLFRMANISTVPDETAVNEFRLMELSSIFLEHDSDAVLLESKIVEKSLEFLTIGRAEEAWMCLLALNI